MKPQKGYKNNGTHGNVGLVSASQLVLKELFWPKCAEMLWSVPYLRQAFHLWSKSLWPDGGFNILMSMNRGKSTTVIYSQSWPHTNEHSLCRWGFQVSCHMPKEADHTMNAFKHSLNVQLIDSLLFLWCFRWRASGRWLPFRLMCLQSVTRCGKHRNFMEFHWTQSISNYLVIPSCRPSWTRPYAHFPPCCSL